ncbi:uncharacterized protein B0I36DRAFT_331500 [Microdochium trichocladiopsis]|uniref:Zn(2)-C6 fungal-type domain-containing protein n=1 Tax=Microdochium trichocladiopsis TaxID=1682393 RepID=A0A9P8XX70_9PEZI|nr:uncharacterized protein B0I36DRAFT_331500 [Microdochium trichocladiopsis]KAH7024483.1 hypothetical protein B0I36DRAFT_331500 [Microdochium trichocladiopsis]
MADRPLESAPIACELCRTKKQKCDRKRPVCSNCLKAPNGCHYLEQSRRGLPAGYLHSLEQRLADTENALYFALSELLRGIPELGDYRSAAAQVARPTQSQSKADAIQAWTKWPLNNRDQACAWFAFKHGQAGSTQSPSAGPHDPGARPGISPTTRETRSTAPASAAALQWTNHTEVVSVHEDVAAVDLLNDAPPMWTTPPQQDTITSQPQSQTSLPAQNITTALPSSSPSSSRNVGSRARSLARERKTTYF